MKYLDRIVRRSITKSDIIREVRESSFNILGVGNDRVVVDIGNNRVAKIDVMSTQNQVECDIQNSQYSDYFCPIVERDPEFCWIICKKAREATMDEKIQFVRKFISETGQLPKDIELDDIGKIDNICVFIDYGYGLRQVEKDPKDIIDGEAENLRL